MANPNPKTDHLHKIKPGEVRNPKGGSRKASERKLMNQLGRQEIEEIGKLILSGNVKALEEVLESMKKGGAKDQSVIKTLFASVALKAIIKGDANALSTVLDRLIGKVPSPVQLTSPDGSMRPQVILQLPDNGRRAK